MITTILLAAALAAATVALHAGGFSLVMRALVPSHAAPPVTTWPIAWLLIRATWWLLLIHMAEIVVWALLYRGAGCLPDAESAFYFSAVTYTTIGYGDVVLTKPWRMLAPVEGLTGILMCGLSAGLFFAVVNRLVGSRFVQRKGNAAVH